LPLGAEGEGFLLRRGELKRLDPETILKRVQHMVQGDGSEASSE